MLERLLFAIFMLVLAVIVALSCTPFSPHRDDDDLIY